MKYQNRSSKKDFFGSSLSKTFMKVSTLKLRWGINSVTNSLKFFIWDFQLQDIRNYNYVFWTTLRIIKTAPDGLALLLSAVLEEVKYDGNIYLENRNRDNRGEQAWLCAAERTRALHNYSHSLVFSISILKVSKKLQ